MKEINLVAGFDPENNLNDDLERAAKEVGWKLNRICHIDSEKILKGELEDELPNNVLWRRELVDNSQKENDLVWEWLDKNKKITMNTHVTGGRVRPIDKYFQQELYKKDELLREYAVPSFVAKNATEAMELFRDKKLTFPIVLKPRYGSLGKGIIYVEDAQGLLMRVLKLERLGNMVIEPYIDIEYDWRVFVIGGEAIGAMRKVGDKNNPLNFEAKSAGWQKWNEEDEETKKQLYKISERAAKVMNLEYAGVDLVREQKTGKIYIVETNLSAGWNNGFSEITGADVARKIVDWFVFKNRDLAK